MNTTIKASCLCGKIRWEIDGPLEVPSSGDGVDVLKLLSMSHCHCSRCRKAHGAPYATFLLAREEQFTITHGKGLAVRYESAPGGFRTFCGDCGSVVPDGTAWSGYVGMPAGPFDADPGLRPASHLFVGSKAPWVSIQDDLPRFDAYPPGIEMPAKETRAPLDPDSGATRGSCLCGQVTYLVEAPPLRCRTCHCSRCRKAGSAAHLSYLVTRPEGLRFTRGSELLITYKVPEARYFSTRFCRNCGSKMPRHDAARGIAIIPMGSLDDDPGVRPASHIWADSKAPWDAITDSLPCVVDPPSAA
jgi:hypothetical protein